MTVLEQPCTDVLAHRCSWGDGTMVALHNLGPEPRTVPIRLDDCDDSCRLVDLLQVGSTDVDGSGRAELTLEAYGYRWLRLTRPGDRRLL
jgi:hypothetical protein